MSHFNQTSHFTRPHQGKYREKGKSNKEKLKNDFSKMTAKSDTKLYDW